MKLVGLILVGLCSGFVSGTWFDPIALRRPYFNHKFNDYCKQILNEYSFSRRIGFPFHKNNDNLRLCGIQTGISARFNPFSNTNFRHVSTEMPSTTISASTPVLITTKVSSEIRNREFSNILTSEKKIAKDTNLGKPDDFSTETSSLLKRNTDSTNPKISDDGSIEISKGSEGTTEITSPEVSDESSSTQESYATEKSTDITNTTTSADFSKEISEATDVTSETTNSKAPDVHTSDETPGVTSDVANSTFTDQKEQTESPSKLTEGTSDVNDSSTPSPPVTTISKSTSDETTHVTDSLETFSFTAGISESIISSVGTEMQTTSYQSHSTSTKNTVFMSTDYTTSEKTTSDREGGSSSTTVPSNSIRPNFLSTTRLHSTETTMNTSPRSQETTLDHRETTHSIYYHRTTRNENS